MDVVISKEDEQKLREILGRRRILLTKEEDGVIWCAVKRGIYSESRICSIEAKEERG